MTKTVKVFDFDIDFHGARVVVVRTPLTASCLSDGDVEHAIQLLKDDLDTVAERMKQAIRAQLRKADF